ncbi:MAG TPA: hypothetical protein PK344_00150 [Syntrophorhabdaceae bacterium]|nr:hypothetical protein [Syntrophorhabdaceae bacterium]
MAKEKTAKDKMTTRQALLYCTGLTAVLFSSTLFIHIMKVSHIIKEDGLIVKVFMELLVGIK